MRSYAPPAAWTAGEIRLDPDETRHLIRVLRRQAGDLVEVSDGQGRRAEGILRSTDRRGAVIQVTKTVLVDPPPLRIHLLAGVVREQKMDLLIQKAVELGVASIRPVIGEHAVVQLRGERAANRRARWESVVLAAAKQCGAAWRPGVFEAASLAEALEASRPAGFRILCSLAAGAEPLSRLMDELRSGGHREVTVLVGPEGDLSEAEHAAAREAGFRPVSLGDSVLRAETAALYVLSVLKYEFL
jgi:16S rRNA (uracil1498-N3)-methyltransferase